MLARDGEALLVGPGSPDNLVGAGWGKRHEALIAKSHVRMSEGRPTHEFKVGGVSKESQTCSEVVKH
eukprot:11159516-Lingulodinium_polyedra.AAC.1